jgi:hypothetical protein
MRFGIQTVTATETNAQFNFGSQSVTLYGISIVIPLGTTTDNITLTINKNLVATAITVTLPVGNIVASAVFSPGVTFSPTDLASIHITQSGTETSAVNMKCMLSVK